MSTASSGLLRDISLVLLGGTTGVLSLIALAPWETAAPNSDAVAQPPTVTESKGKPGSRSNGETPSLSVDHGPEIRVLKQRIDALETAAKTAKRSVSTSVERSATGEAKGSDSGQENPSTEEVSQQQVNDFVEQIQKDDSPVRTAVQGMIDDAWQNRRQEWRAIRSASNEARDNERVERFSQKVELTDGQREAISTAISEERDRVRQVRRTARETLDFEGVRDKVKELRSETDEGLAEFLNAEQLDAWQTFRKEEWRGRRR